MTSSSQHSSWSADKAVDGNTKRAPNDCDCCAATQATREPWFKLDLGQQYKIYSISVLGRGGPEDGGGGYGRMYLIIIQSPRRVVVRYSNHTPLQWAKLQESCQTEENVFHYYLLVSCDT